MGILDVLLGFSIIALCLIVFYLVWINDRISKLDEKVRKLEKE